MYLLYRKNSVITLTYEQLTRLRRINSMKIDMNRIVYVG